jgi:hypothetical protein
MISVPWARRTPDQSVAPVTRFADDAGTIQPEHDARSSSEVEL